MTAHETDWKLEGASQRKKMDLKIEKEEELRSDKGRGQANYENGTRQVLRRTSSLVLWLSLTEHIWKRDKFWEILGNSEKLAIPRAALWPMDLPTKASDQCLASIECM
jgi:hypothetical protein